MRATTLRSHGRTIPDCYRRPPFVRGPRDGSTRWVRIHGAIIIARTEGVVACTASLRPCTASIVLTRAAVRAGQVGAGAPFRADDPISPAGSLRPDDDDDSLSSDDSLRPGTSIAALLATGGTTRNLESRQPAAHDHSKRAEREPDVFACAAISAWRHEPEARIGSAGQSRRQRHQEAVLRVTFLQVRPDIPQVADR